MNERKEAAKKWFVVAIALMLISGIGASLVQTQGGRVTVKDLRWETPAGRQLSALLLRPATATANNPAPAVVVSHGWFNHREMQDLNFVELARRGYVVLSIDMYGHGHSDLFPAGTGWDEHGTGMYDAVLLLASLPYVDSSRIGVTGHSNGARAANLTVMDDNAADVQLVSAVLLVAFDPVYRDPVTNEFWNMYGSRDVGLIAARYDEFFFRREFADGTLSVPRTFMGTPDAQSFLHFGRDPDALETRAVDTYYREVIDGRQAIRVIHQPNQTHPWNHFSRICVEIAIDFFEASLGAPNPLPANNQIWQWKVFFNAIGLVGFGLFFVNFIILMLFTPFFSSLRTREVATPLPAPKGKNLIIFWGGLCFVAFIAAITFFHILEFAAAHRPQAIFRQLGPFGIGVWAALCGLASIVVMALYYNLYGKHNGLSLAATGVKISRSALGKTIVLSVTAVSATYMTVFITDYFFQTDFRIWVLSVRTFRPDTFIVMLPYIPLFLLFYVANSVAINCFNYNGVGKTEWGNTAILAGFNALGPVVMVIAQYVVFVATGEILFYRPAFILGPLGGIWLIPVIVFLIAAAICSRKLYRVTRNPYLAGIANGLLVVVITCTNTLTVLPV
ncbi:MAG: alpha/beta fold hydrolase [Treponema sp.]|nr:alpha/beta fold hydrolase [Treponema sp.]